MAFRKAFLLAAIYILICNCQSQETDDVSPEIDQITYFQRPQPSKGQLEFLIRDPRYRYVLQRMLLARKRDKVNEPEPLKYNNDRVISPNPHINGPGTPRKKPEAQALTTTQASTVKRTDAKDYNDASPEDILLNILLDGIKQGKLPYYCKYFDS